MTLYYTCSSADLAEFLALQRRPFEWLKARGYVLIPRGNP